MRLWYTSPASTWNEALPIGNGHIAGMVFGGVESEKLSLNDETIWYRGPADRNNPDSASHLDEIRSLLAKGDVRAAEDLVAMTMFATPRDQSHYEVLGELFVEQPGVSFDGCSAYERELDLDGAVSRVRFESDGVAYTREYFTSLSENVLLARFTSSRPGSLSLRATLGRCKRFNDRVRQFQGDGIVMSAHAGGAAGVGFEVGLRAISCDGVVRVLGETIVVDDASEVVFALVSETNYWRGPDVEPDVAIRLQELSSLDYEAELSSHTAAYREQFDRVSLDVASGGERTDAGEIATDELIACAGRGGNTFPICSTWHSITVATCLSPPASRVVCPPTCRAYGVRTSIPSGDRNTPSTSIPR